ncbi:polyprenyl diphosphate synthase [Pigmentiphaga soli]|uniref:Isoprenyl transferase n=1 Tax=Pigmentiphaga soli TaxID=1007095 RepID=A0ABP8HE61_9BURK
MALSSTLGIPQAASVPRHVAIIMDGNGRWATRRFLPRVAGHKKGVDAVRTIVEACAERGVEFLTLFAFSSENWRRPPDEVSLLMRLFIHALEREVTKLDRNGIRLKVVGDITAFEPRLQELIREVEARTADNRRLTLTIAANYGGRWDILQAMRRALLAHPELADQPERLDEALLSPFLAMAYAPEPDLFIRTGGEKRISNFLIWQLAYTELYFTDCFWPDFDAAQFDLACESYRRRERRFGRTSAQLEAEAIASEPAAGH